MASKRIRQRLTDIYKYAENEMRLKKDYMHYVKSKLFMKDTY